MGFINQQIIQSKLKPGRPWFFYTLKNYFLLAQYILALYQLISFLIINSPIYQILMQESHLESNDLYSIPESIVMQNLTHFFLSPSAKQLPYYSFFYHHHSSSLYALSYIYNFIRTPIRSSIIEHIITKLFQKSENQQFAQTETIKNVIHLILGSHAYIDRKTLLSRYISLPQMLGELLSRKKVNIKKVQQKIVEQVCKVIEKLTLEEKVILIGHISIMLSQKNVSIIKENYLYIVKKQAVIIFFLRKYLQEGERFQFLETLKNLLQVYHEPQNHSLIVNILHRQFFAPSHSYLIHSLFSAFMNLQKQLFNDLLVWWSQGVDNYMVYNMIKFRANLLTLFIRSLPEDRIFQCSGIIALGIERRLMTLAENRKQVVNLVWGQLGRKLKLQLKIPASSDLLKDDQKSCQSSNSFTNNQKQIELSNKPTLKKNQKNLGQINLKEIQETKSNKKQQTIEGVRIDEERQIYELKPKAPRNLYDCILGMRNPSRKEAVLKSLPNMIRLNPDDLLFIWRDLIQQLIYCLNQETKQSCVSLFVTKPDHFIQSVAQTFFSKQASLNDKIILMQVLSDGVEELSQRPKEVEQEKQAKQFYFKKVKSKYYKQNQQIQVENPKKQEKTRRWGHTRIAYEQKLQKSSNSVSLFVVNNQPYVNRLYQVAVKLFFKIISRLTMVSIFPSEPMFTNPLLKLLGTLSSNLKNHIEKYKILGDVVQSCLQVIEHIEGKLKKAQEKTKNLKIWKDTNLNVLNTLNKVSLVLDKFIPERILTNLQKCIQKLKNAKQYGIAPIINMIQANIYTNVSGQPTNF